MLPPLQHSPSGPPFAISVALAAVEVWVNSTAPPGAPGSPPGSHVKVPLPALELPIKLVKLGDASMLLAPVMTKLPLAALEPLENKTPPPSSTVKVPLPALEASEKDIRPLLKNVPLPAVELPKKRINVNPPLLRKPLLPAVELSWNSTPPPPAPPPGPIMFKKLPLPALELSKNCVMPPSESLDGGPLLVKPVRFPTVALFLNCIVPRSPLISAVVTKFCATPELFAVPAPLTVNVNVGPAVIMNALAPALNTMPSTSVLAERETPVVLEEANVAVSVGPLGGPPAVQLVAVFQSPELGFCFQVALPAKAVL